MESEWWWIKTYYPGEPQFQLKWMFTSPKIGVNTACRNSFHPAPHWRNIVCAGQGPRCMGQNLAFEAQTPCQDEPWPDYLAVSTKEPSALNSAEAVWKCLFLFLHQWSLRLATSRIKLTYVLPSWLPKSAKIAKSLKSAAPSFKIRLAHDARTTFIPLDPTRFLLSMNFMQRTQSSLRWTSRKRRAKHAFRSRIPVPLCTRWWLSV